MIPSLWTASMPIADETVTNGIDVLDDVSETEGVVGDSISSEVVSDNRFF
ncbi:1030_t:CDS:2 [Paraglomus brasilianum]|uniref:1030_t:CDS:1 n=1 Tax=Paraglomus brasilianum TaxID=144538 RepID=A0A9N9C5U9_9GLOM|nr:1030_t:CDS:2 [Paraglomus brasilianum]